MRSPTTAADAGARKAEARPDAAIASEETDRPGLQREQQHRDGEGGGAHEHRAAPAGAVGPPAGRDQHHRLGGRRAQEPDADQPDALLEALGDEQRDQGDPQAEHDEAAGQVHHEGGPVGRAAQRRGQRRRRGLGGGRRWRRRWAWVRAGGGCGAGRGRGRGRGGSRVSGRAWARCGARVRGVGTAGSAAPRSAARSGQWQGPPAAAGLSRQEPRGQQPGHDQRDAVHHERRADRDAR